MYNYIPRELDNIDTHTHFILVRYSNVNQHKHRPLIGCYICIVNFGVVNFNLISCLFFCKLFSTYKIGLFSNATKFRDCYN